ncbi:alpha/beta hydrolase [Streptomyces sp. SCA2-4]|nr:alpha/beta hydrolase [Streptomyces huiliensis]
MTEYLTLRGKRIAYDATGDGPLVVLAHGMGDNRDGVEPARLAALEADLRRPGRMAVVARMGMSAPTDAGARLADVRCPVLIVQGTLDPDWPDPRAEGEGIVAELPADIGRLELIEGAGHYPHVECPDRVTAAVLAFLGLGEGVRA